MEKRLHPHVIIAAYKQGYFPMAEEFDGKIYWHSPDPRAIFPINELKPPRTMRKILNSGRFSFSINQRFPEVITQCANRPDTWISPEIIKYFIQLHYLGFVHSLEVYEEGLLVGGLYGVAIGAVFCGESMFSHVPNASKAAFYVLIERLKARGYKLLDSQYINDHTAKLGAIEIPKIKYLEMLESAILIECNFY